MCVRTAAVNPTNPRGVVKTGFVFTYFGHGTLMRLAWSHSVVVSTGDFESPIVGSNPSGTSFLFARALICFFAPIADCCPCFYQRDGS